MPSVSGLRDGRGARRSNGAGAGERSPGVGTGRPSKRDGQPKPGRSRRWPRALPLSEGPRSKRRAAVKSVGAGETGGSGRRGDEGSWRPHNGSIRTGVIFRHSPESAYFRAPGPRYATRSPAPPEGTPKHFPHQAGHHLDVFWKRKSPIHRKVAAAFIGCGFQKL